MITHTKFYRTFHLHKSYTEVRIDQYFSDIFPFWTAWKKRQIIAIFFINFALEYAIRKTEVLHFVLELNETHEILVCSDFNWMDDNTDNVKWNAEDSVVPVRRTI